MSLAADVAAAARALEAGLLSDTCTITPAVADGDTATPVTVKCAVVQPTAMQGPYGGGGNQIAENADKTIMLPRTTAIHAGDAIHWNGGNLDYSVGWVVTPRSHDPLLYAQCVEVTT